MDIKGKHKSSFKTELISTTNNPRCF